jgi:hypothetical protein
LGGRYSNASGASRRGVVNLRLDVIARSEATKQSILSLRGTMDCFASLAMTVYFGFSKIEYERATFSAVIAREGGRSSIPRR